MIYAFLVISCTTAIEVTEIEGKITCYFVDLASMVRSELDIKTANVVLRRSKFLGNIYSLMMREEIYSKIVTPKRSIEITERFERQERNLKYLAVQMANYIGGNKNAFT